MVNYADEIKRAVPMREVAAMYGSLKLTGQETSVARSTTTQSRQCTSTTAHAAGGALSAMRAVMCIETGKVYDTLAEAAEDVNIKCKSNIIAVCKNNRKTCGGYHWRYAE